MTEESRKDERRTRFDRKKKKLKRTGAVLSKHINAEPFKRSRQLQDRGLDYEY